MPQAGFTLALSHSAQSVFSTLMPLHSQHKPLTLPDGTVNPGRHAYSSPPSVFAQRGPSFVFRILGLLQLPLRLLEVMVPSRSMTRSTCCVTRTDFYHLLCYHHPLTIVRCAPVLPARLRCQEAGIVSCCSVCPGLGWAQRGCVCLACASG